MRCTVGEISYALEKAWGRHTASTAVSPGFYAAARGAAAAGVVAHARRLLLIRAKKKF